MLSWFRLGPCRKIDAFELWCWRRLLRVPRTARRSNQSILKEINPEYSLEGLMLKLKLQYWPPDEKNWLIGKDPDARQDWRQEEKGRTEDEMVGWHHRLGGHEFEQAPGIGDEHGSLACCSPWGHQESDTTEWLNNNIFCWFIPQSMDLWVVCNSGLLQIVVLCRFMYNFLCGHMS